VNDKQLVGGAAHWLQNAPDLLDATSLPQIHIHDEHTIRSDESVTASKHARGQFMPRVKHRADRG
jgi:hypothetical protein